MDEWQPIETAPDEEVLLYFPPVERLRKELCLRAMYKVDHAGLFPNRPPSHWMPLPPPPEGA